MKQVIHTQRDGRIRVIEVPAPMARRGVVLVRTAYSLISAGTERTKVEIAKKSLIGKAMARPDQVRQVLDSARQLGIAATFQKISSRMDALTPLGYSSAGIVLHVGANVTGFAPGDRVACGGATAAHAEIVAVPQNLCVLLPENVALEEAAFATVGAVALQGIRRAEPALGECVGVIGLGLLGLLTVQMLRGAGCRVVGVDPDAGRSDLARQFGADAVFAPGSPDAERATRRLAPSGLDAVIITAASSSSTPVMLAGQLARDRAKVVIVGAVPMNVPRSPFYEKELDLRLSRSYGPGRYDPQYEEKGADYPIGYVRWTEGRNLGAVVDLIAQRKVDCAALTTHRFPIAQAEDAYSLIEHGAASSYLGVLLDHGVSGSATRPSSAAIHVGVGRSGTAGVAVGLIGAGNFAQSMLLPHLSCQPGVRLRTVVTAGALSARSMADRAGFEQCAGDTAEVFNDPVVNLVVIASRHQSHAELAIAAIGAGKAVFVEKPVALSAAEQESVIAAFNDAATARADSTASPFLMVGFNRRFQPLVARMQTFIRAGQEPLLIHYRVNAGFIPREHWTQDREEGGGRIIGEVCHFVDLVLHLSGQRAVEVMAHALPDLGRYQRDNVSALLRLSDGGAATITYAANGDRALEKERIEVFSGGRAAVLDDFRRLTLAFSGKQTVHKSGPDKGHRREMEALVAALASGRASPVPFDEAVHAMDVTFAIEASLACGSTVPVVERRIG